MEEKVRPSQHVTTLTTHTHAHTHQLVTMLLLQRDTSCVILHFHWFLVSQRDSRLCTTSQERRRCWKLLLCGFNSWKTLERWDLNLLPVNEANVSLIEPNKFYQAHSQWRPAQCQQLPRRVLEAYRKVALPSVCSEKYLQSTMEKNWIFTKS